MFSHRITDSKDIKQIRVPRVSQPHRRLRFLGLRLPWLDALTTNMWRGLQMLLLGFIFVGSAELLPSTKIGYRIQFDGQERNLNAKVGKTGLVELTGKGDFKKQFTLSEFDALPNKHYIALDSGSKIFVVVGYFYFSLGIVWFLLSGINGYRGRRILSMIAGSEKT